MPSLHSIGCDVEILARTPNNIHKSLCGLVGGTKENPFQLPHLPKGFCVQEDNVSLEFNIPPANTRNAFVGSVKKMVEESSIILKTHGYIPSDNCAVSFSLDQLQHPKSQIFGCEPDYDAWKMVENPKPIANDPNLRTAGGHIHVGTDLDMISGIQNMDLFLGVPSILLDDSPSSNLRRKLYGKAGAMRPKHYGFEYRVLSNFWIFKEEFIEWVYTQTRQAVREKCRFSSKQAKEIQQTINEGDKDAANRIINVYGIALPTFFTGGAEKTA